MVTKIITDEGKHEILLLITGQRNLYSVFDALAYGKGTGEYNQSSIRLINEHTGNNYRRVQATFPPDENTQKKVVGLSGELDNSNIDVPVGSEEYVTEIGLVNSIEPNVAGEVFLCMTKVPDIKKNNELSFVSVIVLEIE